MNTTPSTLPLFVWDEKYSVGIESIDSQHKSLIELINNLHRGIQAGHSESATSEALHALIDYAKQHFSEEESIMKRIKYSGYITHKAAHDAFIQTLADLITRQIRERFTVGFDTLDFLKKWLIEHILGTDQNYRADFLEHGIK